MVFQKAVTFNTSVQDNLAYGLKVRGMGGHETNERVHRALKIVGLEGFERRRAKKLSGGEQQRVSLARALILEPEILLLDEPTANIDPKNASIIESVITNVNRELGTTIIMASHNITQAKQLASRIAALQDGVLVGVTSTNELFGKPSNILENIGRLQNIFPGQAHPTENGLALVDIGNGVKLQTSKAREGYVTLFIKPEDIIVSKMPLVSSARNVLKGRIIEALDRNGLVQLKVDAGREFITTVTRKSFEEMKLNLGHEIYLTFKAQSVQLVT
jgi:tungstate transport system ATP-binding protein